MDQTIDHDLIDSNLLVEEEKNRVNMIDRVHNLDLNILPPSDGLAGDKIIVIRIGRHWMKSNTL